MPADADAIAELNLVAWGAWNHPAMHSWFAATVGRAGWQHYGVFDGDRLVSTGALPRATTDSVGSASMRPIPRHQGKQLRQAISALRLADAGRAGLRDRARRKCDRAGAAGVPRRLAVAVREAELLDRAQADGVADVVTERYADLLAAIAPMSVTRCSALPARCGGRRIGSPPSVSAGCERCWPGRRNAHRSMPSGSPVSTWTNSPNAICRRCRS